MTKRSVRHRIAVTAGIVAMIFAVLMGRAVQLTILEGSELRGLAERQHRQRVALPPKRGPIVDRFGEPLALTRESAAVYVRPRQLEAGAETLSMVARLLGIAPNVMAAKVAAPAPFVWLDRQVPLDRWASVEELGVPGIGSERTRVRVYPHGGLAGHVLGFTSIDGQGLEGIERGLDADLRGEVEALDVERDARGRRMVVDGGWRPLPRVGATVELTIDAALQRAAEAALQKAVDEFQAEAGTAVVLEPHTGEVLALANEPRFDPNQFSGSSPGEWRNRAVTDVYEPGSTFKAFLAAAALDTGSIRAQDKIYCEHGRYPVGRRVIHDHHPLGVLTFAEVIHKSSNIGCAKVAEQIGSEGFAVAIERFGFGRKTGIDLPGEVPGMVRPVERWGRIHLITTAFGQGIAVTALQLTRAFAAIANGGVLMRPYVVRRVSTEDGRMRHVGRPHAEGRVISREAAAVLTDILRGVVEEGTGRQAKLDGFTVAGKTGTAQKVDPGTGRYHPRARMSSFIGFVPADDPRLVILVVIDSPRRATYGGVVAAPAFRQIAEVGLQRRGVRPEAEPEPPAEPPGLVQRVAAQLADLPEIDDQLAETGAFPTFIGLSMRDALIRARQHGLTPHIEGSGYVVAQSPPPGSDPAEGEIWLEFGSPLN